MISAVHRKSKDKAPHDIKIMLIGLISRKTLFKTVACLTTIAFAVLTVTSCVSFKVNQIAIESAGERPSSATKIYIKAPEEG